MRNVSKAFDGEKVIVQNPQPQAVRKRKERLCGRATPDRTFTTEDRSQDEVGKQCQRSRRGRLPSALFPGF
jgi:hypothetical protein